MKEESKTTQAAIGLTIVLFVIYLTALCWILILKLGVQFSYMEKRSVNFITFREPSLLSVENILNTIIFVPMGIYAGILFKRWSFGKNFLFVFLLSLLVETLQYILRIGAFDVTDIITNTLGGIIGLMIYKAIEKGFNNGVRAQKFINIVAATKTVITILLLVLLKMNKLPIRYQ